MKTRYICPEVTTVIIGNNNSLMAGSQQEAVSEPGDAVNTGNAGFGDAANAASRRGSHWWDEE